MRISIKQLSDILATDRTARSPRLLAAVFEDVDLGDPDLTFDAARLDTLRAAVATVRAAEHRQILANPGPFEIFGTVDDQLNLASDQMRHVAAVIEAIARTS